MPSRHASAKLKIMCDFVGILKWFKNAYTIICVLFLFFQLKYLFYDNMHLVSFFHQPLLHTNINGLNESQTQL